MYKEVPPTLEIGAVVKRRYITERQTVIAIEKNVALVNQIGYIHTTSHEDFHKYYVAA